MSGEHRDLGFKKGAADLLPHYLGHEKAVLSLMMRESKYRARTLAAGIGEDHFFGSGRAGVFRHLVDCYQAEGRPDLVSLHQELNDSGVLETLGGSSALYDIYTYAPNGWHFENHLEWLRKGLAQRQAVKDALKLAEEAPNLEPDELRKALADMHEFATRTLDGSSGVLTATQAAEQLVARMTSLMQQDATVPGLSTGLPMVDHLTGGMSAGELWVVCGQTSHGKSVLLLQAAAAALTAGKRVLVISLEMEAHVVTARLVANLASVPLGAFNTPGAVGRECLQKAADGARSLAEMPLSIDSRGGRCLEEIEGLAQAESDRHGGLDLVIVDYLQIVDSGGRRGEMSREQEVAGISRGLKALAKKLAVPVLTASQLNDEGRLRESRAIGQDADVVLAIAEDGLALTKNRNGERTKGLPYFLNGRFQRFEGKK
ncbi:MAG: DnaB domain protein helicase domain protein [Akkermansiaceae bacterium]|nr:DnaB domain protein helicase domain protein [Akkermansiaceae bacterium]